ncbi:MAG TPA: LuxR C-terminal-related transcriptional regulator [Micropepsaceae bacterium]|nr:LuxR C-terminal-related transcriptional regulator [Micropepsaceae bacterium]
MSELKFSRALGAIYDAAMDESRWEDALRSVAELFDSDGANLVVVDQLPRANALLISSTVADLAAAKAYRDYYHAVDPALQAYYSAGAGVVQTTDEIVARSGVRHEENEFYRDWASKIGIHRAMGGLVLQDTQRTAIFAIYRGKRSECFSTEESRRYNELSVHLRRALQMRRQFTTLGEQNAVTYTALDHLSNAVIVLDAQGRTIYMNQAAGRIVERRDALEVANDGSVTPLASIAARWLSRRLSALNGGHTFVEATGGMTWLPRKDGQPTYTMLLAPIAGEAGRASLMETGRQPRAILFIKDPLREAQNRDAVLARFRLTKSERALANAIVAGKRLDDHASERSLSINTVRFHLRSIFSKMCVSSQSELVALVLRETCETDFGLENLP